MFDLNEQPKLPQYVLKLTDGETKSYDTLLISYQLSVLDKEKDPAKIHEVICRVFEVKIEAWEAMLVLNDFTKFADKNLEEPLKNVFGEQLYSAISTDSPQENSKTSSQQNISD